MDTKEKYFIYFFCDPFKPFNKLIDNTFFFSLSYTPYYCGKGTMSRLKTLHRSKPINDKTQSIIKRGKHPIVVQLGPFDEETAFEQEKFFINFFKRRDLREDGLLLNLKDGGSNGARFSEETRKKQSESHIGHTAWNKGKKTGIEPWNKGLTKENSMIAIGVEKMRKKKIGLMWFTDGVTDVQSKECPEGFVRGRSKVPFGIKRGGKQIIIDGILFSSISAAAKHFNTTGFKIKKRAGI